MDEYVTSLLPGTETSVSIVRDVRARLYEDHSALSRTDIDSIPVKLDVETLYILEQKAEKKPLASAPNSYEFNRASTSEQHTAAPITIPVTTIKSSPRPAGAQLDSGSEQHTVSGQTTDSLHRAARDQQRLPSPPSSPVDEAETSKITTTTITTTRYEIKRRHSSHHESEEEADDGGGAVIYIDDKENFELKAHSSADDQLPIVPEQRSSFGQVTSRIRIDQLRDINRNVVRRHVEQHDSNQDEHRSSEVYEIHTRGACKCLVVSADEKTQYGAETRFEKQLQRIERTYTEEELRGTELHVIVASSDADYRLVQRSYAFNEHEDDDRREHSGSPTVLVHYYNKDGQRMNTDRSRRLENLPLFIRCEIEYELNHYGTSTATSLSTAEICCVLYLGSSQLVVLAVTNAERRQMNVVLKKELVDDIVAHTGGQLPATGQQLENEVSRQLAEPVSLLHLVDYSSRDDYNQTNSTDLRRVSRIDVSTSLRLVQRYRALVHRLCQQYRSRLRLNTQAEQQRHLILVARDEYYFLDLASQAANVSTSRSNIQQRQHDIFKREVHQVTQPPFDYAKYRRDAREQQRILEQSFRQRQTEQRKECRQTHQGPPPPGHPSEAEFYLGRFVRVSRSH